MKKFIMITGDTAADDELTVLFFENMTIEDAEAAFKVQYFSLLSDIGIIFEDDEECPTVNIRTIVSSDSEIVKAR